MRDTIVAIASAPGAAERGIVRLSGARTRELVGARLEGSFPAGRGVHAVRLRDARGVQPAHLLWMPGPHSYTREDTAELHLSGNPHLLAAALEALLSEGARRAQPGEFTRRAFENGRLDLTRAEGVLELVEARNEDERRAAIALLEGGLSRRVGALRETLDGVRALCEATLDFDEADTGHVPTEEIARSLEAAAADLDAALAFEQARPPRAGLPRVMLVGAPNAGKSTLFNALRPADAVPAIVSDLAGTTRDPLCVEVPLASGGIELFDLAGLATVALDELDAAGQGRARALLESADLLLPVVRADRGDEAAVRRELQALPANRPRLGLWTQCDRPDAQPAPSSSDTDWLCLGRDRPEGIERLRAALDRLLTQLPTSGALSRELAEAHRSALDWAHEALSRAHLELQAGGELDLVASTLRLAVDALDDLVGHTSPEELLDRIFSRFCIGK